MSVHEAIQRAVDSRRAAREDHRAQIAEWVELHNATDRGPAIEPDQTHTLPPTVKDDHEHKA